MEGQEEENVAEAQDNENETKAQEEVNEAGQGFFSSMRGAATGLGLFNFGQRDSVTEENESNRVATYTKNLHRVDAASRRAARKKKMEERANTKKERLLQS